MNEPQNDLWPLRVWQGAIVAVAIFGAAAIIFPNNQLTEFLRLLQVAVGTAVLVAYAPDALKAFWGRRPDYADQLVLGICCGFLSVVGVGIWSLLWRGAGQPAWMFNSDVNAFLAYMTVLAGTLHATAPGAIEGRIPPWRRVWWAALTGLATVAIGFILVAQPSTKPVVDWLEKRFAEPLSGRRGVPVQVGP